MEESKLDLIAEPEGTLLHQLKSRCEKSGIKHKLDKFEDEYWLLIYLPSGREKREIFITDQEAKKLAQVDFEKYVFVEGYQSICCYEDGYIEAYIRLLRQKRIQTLFSRLLNIPYAELKEAERENLVFEVKKQIHNGSPIVITISQPTDTILLLSGRELEEESDLTIKIAGLKISTNQQAAAILEKLANSLFLQIESSTGFSLMLETYYERPRLFFTVARPGKEAKKTVATFPKYEYDRDPLNLYWYAKSASRMPLLQFLAYYQVLEFYFPTYAGKEAIRAVANIVKDPAFNPDQAVQVGKIVSAVVSKTGRGYGEEKQQLRATIQECVEEKEIREFLEEHDYIEEYFKSDFKKLSPKKVSIANKDLDLRDQIAERSYDIRCKIVHTKAGETEAERILTFTKEESFLPIDIDIIEFIARKAIIAGSKKLSM